ncbi:DedA family protein [Brevibacillus massiliensis]|jgi:membrane protein DedA with SNARE-associated domain|uniref:DedA family protein n=1 Tax=Brevibacillus massiliensis TaxID=1118054 RepID=UPI0002D81F5C
MEINLDLLISLIEQYGYFALFFLLWLGIVGLPIPDELVVATGGFVASQGYLDPVYTFLVDYLGVVSGLSIGYLLGRLFGKPILKWLSRKKKMERHIERSVALIHKYGAFSLCLSYLLPVVRHVVPYIVATGGMKYRRYAMFSYTTGLVWTFCFYEVGFLFGKNMWQIVEVTRRYGFYALAVLVALLVVMLLVRRRRIAN